MRIIFAGAERASSRNKLHAAGVTDIAFNLSSLNVPKSKSLDVERMKGGATLTVYVTPEHSLANHDRFLREYIGHIDRIVGTPDYDGSWIGDRYWPVWNDADDVERFAWLAERYRRVAVGDDGVKSDKVRKRIRSIAGRWNAELMVISSKLDTIDAMEWESAIVGSWDSPRRHGETQVWDFKHNRLRRYPAEQKDIKRRSHMSDIERLGVNPDDVQADDIDAVTQLAIRSWQQLALHRNGGYVPTDDDVDMPEDGAVATTVSRRDGSEPAVQSRRAVATGGEIVRHERDQQLLPGWGRFAASGEDGETTGELAEGDTDALTVLRPIGTSHRQCDSCYIRDGCPGFRANHMCAYSIPVEIRTPSQLRAVQRGLIEMQVGRVLHGGFAEQINGEVLDSDLSKNISQVFDMMSKMIEMEKEGDTVRMALEFRGATGSAGGVLSQIFGPKIGQKATEAQELPGGGLNANDTAAYIEAMAAELPRPR